MNTKIIAILFYFCIGAVLFFYLAKEVKADDNKANEAFLIIGKDDTEDSSRTDLLMMITINYQKEHINVLSIPRDSYVPIVCKDNDASDKIAHAYSIGDVEWKKNGKGRACTNLTVSKLFGISNFYTIEIEMESFKSIIDKINGITVTPSFNFCDTKCYQKGVKVELNGTEALSYVRHRKSLPNGDIDRTKNQRDVLMAFFNKYVQLDTLEKTKVATYTYNKIKSNYPMKKMLNLLKKTMKEPEIISATLKGQSFKKDGIYYYQINATDLNYYKTLFNNVLNTK